MRIDEKIENYLDILKDYDEEILTNENWIDLRRETIALIEDLIVDNDDFNISNHLFVLFYGGLMGNRMSTKSLTNDEVQCCLELLTEKITTGAAFVSISNWLLEKRSSNKNVYTRSLELITLSMKHENKLSKVFFFRDAAIWLIRQLSYPDITDYTAGLLPIALNIADSYDTAVAVVGLGALSHIAQHSYKAHLRYYGQADIIYATLKRSIYSQDLEMLRRVVPCLLEFLKAFDPPPCQRISLSTEFSFRGGYDELLRFVLHDLHLCSSASRQIVLVDHLDSIADLMAASMTKFSRPYLKALQSVMLAPEARAASPTVKEMMLRNLLKVLPFVAPIVAFILTDLVKILFAFVDESLQLATQSTATRLIGQVFRWLSRNGHAEVIGSIYAGVEDVLVNKDHFQVVRRAIIAGDHEDL